MKTIVCALIALLGTNALATGLVVQKHAQIVQSINPQVRACVSNKRHFGDLVNNVKASKSQVRVFAVADSRHVKHGQLVRFVNDKRVRVVVRRNALKNVRLSGYNQTRVQCVRTVKVRNRVVRRRVLSSRVFHGALVGRTARQVKRLVDVCR